MRTISFKFLFVVLLLPFTLTISCTKDDDIVEVDKGDGVEETPNIVWQNWYLSVPINSGIGYATSIYYQDIMAGNFTDEESEFFYLNDDDSSYTMHTRFTGYTTSGPKDLDGGSYCRTELREFWKGNQSTDDNWYMNVGETHLMESTLKVEYCEGRGQAYVAQIHGKTSTIAGISNSPATIKVLWDEGELVLEHYVKPIGDIWTSDDIAKPVIARVDNEIFTIKLRVKDGVLAYSLICEAKDINIDFTDVYDYASNGYHYDNYFKTGNYFRYNSDYTQTSQVILYQVKTFHE